MDTKQIIEQIENCIGAIDDVVDSINKEWADHSGPIPAVFFGQLKAYKNCRGMFENLISAIEEGDNE